VKVVLESNIAHLGRIPEFRRKVRRAFENRQGETFRVKWKPYGWIRFVPRADGNYLGFLEEKQLQLTLGKWCLSPAEGERAGRRSDEPRGEEARGEPRLEARRDEARRDEAMRR